MREWSRWDRSNEFLGCIRLTRFRLGFMLGFRLERNGRYRLNSKGMS